MTAFEVELQRVAVYRYSAVKAICLRPGVVASDTSTITSANLQLTATNRSLGFTTASSQADPSFAASGGSASMISEQGAINPDPLRVTATRRVRCDRNRQLLIERHTYVYLTATNAVFADSELVQIMEGGVPIDQSDSAAATAWAQVKRPKGTQIQIEIGGAPDAEQSAGTCTVIAGDYCTTYSYRASFTATALPN